MKTSRWIVVSLLLLLTLNLAAQTAQTPAQPAQAAREDGLYATFKTTQGDITVKLYEKESPITVRNFVSLAQGRKAWKDPKSGQMVRKPLYNGLTFHRVIPGFMIQGGDPQGDGAGDVGFVIPDEFHPSLKFDQPGRLAMANAGPKTGSCQFFITEVPTPHLDGAHTIFGQVIQGQDVVTKIARVPRDANNKPNTPVRITSVVIERVGAAPTPPPAAKKAAPRKAAPKKK
jgi:cyclophilin family peptidyl-prolyl cis-trans isomerase